MKSSNHSLKELSALYRRALVLEHAGKLITINGFTDQVEPLSPDLLWGLADLIAECAREIAFDVVVGEEDKGGAIATAVSLRLRKPLTLARWYTYPIEKVQQKAVVIELKSEYFTGKLILNGIQPGMRVLIVDDTLSTGGTMVSLVKGIRSSGGEVAGAIAIVEKAGEGGKEKVRKETNLTVDTLLSIRTEKTGVQVVQ